MRRKKPMKKKLPKTITTLRVDDEDRQILDELRRLTGQPSASAIYRMAIREALAARQGRPLRGRAA